MGRQCQLVTFGLQPFGPEIVAMVDRHARTTAVAINDFLAGAGEGQVPRADSTGRCNTLITAQAGGVLQMKYRTRTYYSDVQKALMWERWKQGWTLHQIGKLFDRAHTSVQGILSASGGIRPAGECRNLCV